jgi:hypothetical protein
VILGAVALAAIPGWRVTAQSRISGQEIETCRSQAREYLAESGRAREDAFFFDVVGSATSDLCDLATSNSVSAFMIQVESGLFTRWRSNGQVTPRWSNAVRDCAPMQLSALDCASRLAGVRYDEELPAVVRQLRQGACFETESVQRVALLLRQYTLLYLVQKGLPLDQGSRGVIVNRFLLAAGPLTCR